MGDPTLWLIGAAVLAVTMPIVLVLNSAAKWIARRASQNNRIVNLEIIENPQKLKLFLLELEREGGGRYGDIRRFVIVAANESLARRIAEKEGADRQNPNLWLKQASCDAIDMTVPRVVLRDILEL